MYFFEPVWLSVHIYKKALCISQFTIVAINTLVYPLTMYILIIFLFLYNSFHCCLFFLCKGLFFYSMVAHFSVIIYTVRKKVLKYKKLAIRTSHTNAWLRQIADADPEKSLYKNHITTEPPLTENVSDWAPSRSIAATYGNGVFQGSLQKKRSIQATGLTFADMTVHYGANPVRMVTWQQALWRNTETPGTAIITCLSMTIPW